MTKSSLVYFVKPIGMDGPVKIGCSFVPKNRLINLTAWSPWPLEIVVTVEGDSTLEANIHDCFASAHSHREWFRSSPRLRRLMDDLKAGMPIDQALDLSQREGCIRSRARNYSEDSQLRMSYRMRVYWAERKLRKLDEKGAWHTPDYVKAILGRWSGMGRPPSTPSAAEIQQLDEFLADPQRFSVRHPWLRKAA